MATCFRSVLKINFDGSSRGNPGPIRYGGVLRDNQENIEWNYEGYLGTTWNNLVELLALERGLQITTQQNSLTTRSPTRVYRTYVWMNSMTYISLEVVAMCLNECGKLVFVMYIDLGW